LCADFFLRPGNPEDLGVRPGPTRGGVRPSAFGQTFGLRSLFAAFGRTQRGRRGPPPLRGGGSDLKQKPGCVSPEIRHTSNRPTKKHPSKVVTPYPRSSSRPPPLLLCICTVEWADRQDPAPPPRVIPRVGDGGPPPGARGAGQLRSWPGPGGGGGGGASGA